MMNVGTYYISYSPGILFYSGLFWQIRQTPHLSVNAKIRLSRNSRS